MYEGIEYISTYTRKQAIEDGTLIDVTCLAKEAGFKWPVAITRELKSILNTIPKKYSLQDYTGRLWDVLYCAFIAIKRRGNGVQLRYEIICHHEIDDENGHTRIKDMLNLELKVHPGDELEPVITIGILANKIID